MKRIIVIPDSFKGSIASQEFCDIAQEVIATHFPACQVIPLPVADGGEGSVDAFLTACGGQKISLSVTGPKGEPVDSFYGILRDGTTAVVEMAAAAGLPMMGAQKDPLRATTFGVGQLIAHAVDGGAKKILLGLGGSATNDGGCGMAAALGAVFYNAAGESFVPTGGTLCDIHRVDASACREKLAGVELRVLCDIDNPLCGPKGAAAVFGPQKGAGEKEVELLDRGLGHLAQILERDLGVQVLELPGSAAAGGMGAGAVAFLQGKLTMGIEAVLDTVEFDRLAKGADLVISGEGRLDGQTFSGKVIAGVARRAKAAGVPLIAVVGDVADGAQRVYDIGVSAVFSINRLAIDFSQAKPRSKRDLRATLNDIFRFAAVCRQGKERV